MKLLLDENLSRRVAPFVQELYPGSTQVALVDLMQKPDKTIWQYAKENDYVIVTYDADFYELSLLWTTPKNYLAQKRQPIETGIN